MNARNPNRIAYVQYTNPAAYPPLEHSSRILADRGWDVWFLGSGSSGQADSFRFPPHPRIRVRRWRYLSPGWRQKAHYSAFSLWVLRQCWRSRVAWIYASDPLACPAALLASRVLRCRVVYQEHDSPSFRGSAFFRTVLAARGSLCQRATAVVLPNGQRAKAFTAAVRPPCPVLTVWNCPSRCEAEGEMAHRDDKEFRLVYAGSLSEERLPLTVLDALTRLPEQVVLRVIGYETEGFLGYMQRFHARAEALGLAGRVHYLGAMSRHEMLAAIRQCDLGLALVPRRTVDANMEYMAGASNKAFDYMACGLAVLVSDLAAWQAMFVEQGYALACNPADAGNIAEAAHWFLAHPQEAEAVRARGRQRILAEWNYETQFAPVLESLHPS
jgi:glycosyltransferase involved in cell wall biosynthesis